MLQEGNIIYFDPFYFKNGNTPKPKYFLVLKNCGEKTVIASLPTRKNSVPYNQFQEFGCIELPDINLNCFAIAPGKIITENGKFFDFPTFLYGHQIDDYETEFLSEIYPNEGTDFIIWGKINSEIFSAIVECFRTSKSVKRKYKNLLA